jgi:YfiH family protein
MIIPQWPAPDNVKTLVTERETSSSDLKGVSLPPYNRFNLGDHVNDQPDHVRVNRQQLLEVASASGCDEIRWLQQIHGIDCPDAQKIKDGYAADASFTQTNGLACAIMTADCLPVLFCDLQGRQVAAAHAGWKGLAQGVLGNTLKTFTDNGIPADQVIAWLGPAISQSAFEVGPEVKTAFETFDGDTPWADEACFIQGVGDRLQCDIYRLASIQLRYLGLKGIYGAGEEDSFCTFLDKNEAGEARFFSYRSQSVTGRQASMIWLQG